MADYGTESLEDLEAKLQEYRSSLATVETALSESTSEPQLSQLKKDLVEVICLTEDLIKFRVGEVTQPISSQPDRHVEKSNRDRGAVLAASYTTAIEPSNQATHISAINLIGRTCVVDTAGKPAFATIVEVKQNDTQNLLNSILVVNPLGPPPTVKVSQKTTFEVPYESVQLLPEFSNLAANTKCQAIAKQDGRIHTCIIEDNLIEQQMYKVKFIGLSITEYIKYDQVFTPRSKKLMASLNGERDNASSAASAQQVKNRKRKVNEIITPGGYHIPEYLTPKPTDSQHQLLSKKKKVNILKKEQRKEIHEKAAVDRQSAWLSHNRKVAPVTRKTTNSIFSTSDNPSGRVGITGSGKPMTTFTKRERPEYDEIDDV